MQHILMTVCLIANLLACPLRCAVCHSSSTGIEQAQQNKLACQCCAKKAVCPEESESSPGGKRPANPSENDCSCPNCICEGATLTKAPDFAIHAIDSLIHDRVDADSAQLLNSADFSGSEIRIESLLPADMQTALALRQSWCI
jgi:hypothetical protein